MNNEEAKCYIARDGSPGAFAAVVIDPRYAKDTAKTVAAWIRKGATVEMVSVIDARNELLKWERPEDRHAMPDLFGAK